MVSVTRRTVKANGKTYRPEKWYARYKDKEHRIAAFTDKQASTVLARRLEQLVDCREKDVPLPAALREALDALPERIVSHLRRVGSLGEVTGAGSKCLEDHLKT